MEDKKKPQPSSKVLFQIATLKTYQPVMFHQKLDTHFTPKRQGMEKIEITYDPELQLITLKSDKDHKIIVPANVAWMEPK